MHPICSAIKKTTYWLPNNFYTEADYLKYIEEWEKYRKETSQYNLTNLEAAWTSWIIPLQLYFVVIHLVLSSGSLFGVLITSGGYYICMAFSLCTYNEDDELKTARKYDLQMTPIYIYSFLKHLLILIFGIPLAIYYAIKHSKQIETSPV